MIKYLKKVIKSKEAKVAELRNAIKTAETADEVRALGETLDAVLAELQEAKDQLAAAEEDNGDEGEEEAAAADEGRSVNPLHDFRQVAVHTRQAAPAAQADPTDTVEYRTAFMNYVCRGVQIPAEMREAAITTTADAGAVIPTTYLNEIVQEMETHGNIYALVRHLNVQGGVAIPVLSLKPTATWIGETGGSDSQKLSANDKVVFNYYGVECKISQSLLVNVTTLAEFQKLFVPLAAEAIVKAVEIAIFNGTGEGQPLGIAKDTKVKDANKITMTAAEFGSWSAWHKKVKAKMKKAYRNGIFVMAQGSFDGHIDGMVDDVGQPIARVNYGINGEENYRFMGKQVETVEDACIADFDTAAVGDLVAVFFNPKDYAINSNLKLTVVKWVDHDTNEVKNKAIMICDGKLVDANGVLLISKGAE